MGIIPKFYLKKKKNNWKFAAIKKNKSIWKKSKNQSYEKNLKLHKLQQSLTLKFAVNINVYQCTKGHKLKEPVNT